ncbi:hypothetical protein NE604_06825 [Anaerofustis stercorihominis]|nr:hypothetical protein [Anaerofustis stercorihominis]MCQ4795349.1 hypothetical protein [Anaerofustis stercorihominis]
MCKRKILGFIFCCLISLFFMPNYIFSASPITTDGSYEFTGSPGSISVAENVNATITLTDVSISGGTCIDIKPGSNLTLIIKGVNRLAATIDGIGCGIHVPEGAVLTIKGDGKLYATGGSYYNGGSAAIGARADEDSCGTINIESGYVYAVGGSKAAGGDTGAGIGRSFYNGRGGTVNITGVQVVVSGSNTHLSFGLCATNINIENAVLYANRISGNKIITNSIIYNDANINLNCYDVNSDGKVTNSKGTVYGTYEIKNGNTFEIESTNKLEIPSGTSLINNGILTNNGTLTDKGTLINNRVFNNNGDTDLVAGSLFTNNGTINCTNHKAVQLRA